MEINELKPGFVLMDHQFEKGYAILTKVKENGIIHLTTLYKNEDDNVIGHDYISIDDIISRISLGQFSIIEDKEFNKVKNKITKNMYFDEIGLKKDTKLYNRFSCLYKK